jgi:hypothetical protein
MCKGHEGIRIPRGNGTLILMDRTRYPFVSLYLARPWNQSQFVLFVIYTVMDVSVLSDDNFSGSCTGSSTVGKACTKATKNMQYTRCWSSGKSLGPRNLFFLWFQVRAPWLLIWWPLEAYMVVNFRARGISQGARKLARTPTLN